MALPMAHTFSRNITAAAVLGGKYNNIRLKQITSNMNPQFPWITLHDAVATRLVAEHGKINSTYLGEVLLSKLWWKGRVDLQR